MNNIAIIAKLLQLLPKDEEVLTNLRIHILRIILISGLGGVLLIWLNNSFFQTLDAIDIIAYPIFVIVMLALVILLSWRPHYYFFIILTSFLVFIAYTINYAIHTLAIKKGLEGMFSLVTYLQLISLLYIMFFIFLKGRMIPSIASITLIFISGIIVFMVLDETPREVFVISAPALINIFVLQGLQVAFLIAFTQIKGQYTQMRSRTEELIHMATIDYLTGIANRRHIENVISHHFGSSPKDLSIIMLDIDHFKQVNDTYGHDAGDQVLVCVARKLCDHVRSSDTIGRWGGEEFIVVAPNTDPEQAARLAERLRFVLDENTSKDFTLTASFGVAVYRNGDTPDSLVKRADKAMYRAKQLGRNCVELAT